MIHLIIDKVEISYEGVSRKRIKLRHFNNNVQVGSSELCFSIAKRESGSPMRLTRNNLIVLGVYTAWVGGVMVFMHQPIVDEIAHLSAVRALMGEGTIPCFPDTIGV